MTNRQKEFLFELLISEFDTTKQAALRQMFYHSQQIDELNHRREMEEMEKRITQKVLAEFSVSADVSHAIQEIDKLRQAIDRIGK